MSSPNCKSLHKNAVYVFTDVDFSMLSSTDKKDTKEDIMHVFNLFDHDASGKITIEDLRRVADELGEEISDEELRNMIARADTNEDSKLVSIFL